LCVLKNGTLFYKKSEFGMEIEEKTTVAVSLQTKGRYLIVLEKFITDPLTHGICKTFLFIIYNMTFS
jgi:hypothetical protein